MQKGLLRWMPILLLGFTLILTACTQASPAATATIRPTRFGTLATYTGPTATDTPTSGEPDTPTPLPSATPTPRSHTVVKGEDMFGIALRYGVTLEDLMSANPEVDPRWMSIGTVLVIPAALYTPTPDPSNPPQPTPVGLALQQPSCFPSGEGGLWCFTRANNPQNFSVEGLSVSLRLYDRESGQILEQSAFPPLNLLKPGGFLPLAAYIPPPAPRNFDATAELVSALPVPPESGRYLDVQQSDLVVEFAEDGLSASVRGELSLAGREVPARLIYVAAVAIDDAGRIIGLRRWDGEELTPGGTQPFELLVYSAGPRIASVSVLAEGIP